MNYACSRQNALMRSLSLSKEVHGPRTDPKAKCLTDVCRHAGGVTHALKDRFSLTRINSENAVFLTTNEVHLFW